MMTESPRSRALRPAISRTRDRGADSQQISVPPTTGGRFARPTVRGKFLYTGDAKLWVKGVTYGPFRPRPDADGFPDLHVVDQDFTQIAAHGLNAVRTYDVPPLWLLDAATRHGLYVMAGLPWPQHVTFLDDRNCVRAITEQVRSAVRGVRGHPALLCYAIGNEIPVGVVRWSGHRRVESYLAELYRIAKGEDPDSLVTYVNYPSTEYLDLPFLDLVCFNVYLEAQNDFEAYLARLHNIAGDRPLLMAEIGLDSRRHGEERQARALDWQVRTVLASGCAGAFVFAWTDEWYRGGHDIEDWCFGVTDRQRHAKPALAAVREAFVDVPYPRGLRWPHVSVIVCTYNGAATIRRCFEGLLRLEYPNFDVIVVDDGSTDATPAIAREYGFRVISTENRGLSNARNTGLEAASGEIVAYLDDDASPDPHWLTYLAATFLRTSYVAVGGPNIAPVDDGFFAECVDKAPGNPTQVLLSDREAEHIPGCNMAIRKSALAAVGGFDPRFRTAGDDVDVCWRLREKGGSLGFAPGAVVYHHRRNSVSAYWKQQRGYGRAEALLESKWPEKYNALGHHGWTGRVYGNGAPEALGLRRGRIYQGQWGTAPFQSVYHGPPSLPRLLPMMPEWNLVIGALIVLCVLGMFWSRLLFAVPLLGLAVATTLLQAARCARQAGVSRMELSRSERIKLQTVTMFLCILQPVARLLGRLETGLTPLRSRGLRRLAVPWPRTTTVWTERWKMPAARLARLEALLRAHDAVARRGTEYDGWDLQAQTGVLAAVRALAVTEEHGAGKQLTRVRTWPILSSAVVVCAGTTAALSIAAVADRAWIASAVLATGALVLMLAALCQCAAATGAVIRSLATMAETER